MENFTFYSPTYFVFGKDTEREAGALAKRFGASKVLVHFGGKSAKAKRSRPAFCTTETFGIFTAEKKLSRRSPLERF